MNCKLLNIRNLISLTSKYVEILRKFLEKESPFLNNFLTYYLNQGDLYTGHNSIFLFYKYKKPFYNGEYPN